MADATRETTMGRVRFMTSGARGWAAWLREALEVGEGCDIGRTRNTYVRTHAYPLRRGVWPCFGARVTLTRFLVVVVVVAVVLWGWCWR